MSILYVQENRKLQRPFAEPKSFSGDGWLYVLTAANSFFFLNRFRAFYWWVLPNTVAPRKKASTPNQMLYEMKVDWNRVLFSCPSTPQGTASCSRSHCAFVAFVAARRWAKRAAAWQPGSSTRKSGMCYVILWHLQWRDDSSLTVINKKGSQHSLLETGSEKSNNQYGEEEPHLLWALSGPRERKSDLGLLWGRRASFPAPLSGRGASQASSKQTWDGGMNQWCLHYSSITACECAVFQPISHTFICNCCFLYAKNKAVSEHFAPNSIREKESQGILRVPHNSHCESQWIPKELSLVEYILHKSIESAEVGAFIINFLGKIKRMHRKEIATL